jgi:hypothetical protein
VGVLACVLAIGVAAVVPAPEGSVGAALFSALMLAAVVMAVYVGVLRLLAPDGLRTLRHV